MPWCPRVPILDLLNFQNWYRWYIGIKCINFEFWNIDMTIAKPLGGILNTFAVDAPRERSNAQKRDFGRPAWI